MKSRKKIGGRPDTMKISKESNLVLGAIGDQIEPLNNAVDDDPSDPEISSETSEERDFERDFDAKMKKKEIENKEVYFKTWYIILLHLILLYFQGVKQFSAIKLYVPSSLPLCF